LKFAPRYGILFIKEGGTVAINKLALGDNLEILKTIAADSMDLIYLDLSFFSNRNYEVIWGDGETQGKLYE
jgi:hypothetical protein